MAEYPQDDPRIYFAAERTFLAWIRTGLALMALGFALSRFGLFLRQLSTEQTHVASHSTGLSEWSGVVLVLLGVLVNASAVLQHLKTTRELRSGEWVAGRVSRSAVALASALAAAGVALAGYLVFVR